MRTSERGSTLIIATIVVAVVAAIGIGLLRYSSREVAGAGAGQRAEALSICTDAARQLLQSRFKVLGANPTEIVVLNATLDGAAGARFRALGGHIDSDPNGVLITVNQVAALPSQAIGSEAVNLDVSNTLSGQSGAGGPAGTLGGTPLKVTVHCQEGNLTTWTSGRQLEIEFGIRFGL